MALGDYGQGLRQGVGRVERLRRAAGGGWIGSKTRSELLNGSQLSCITSSWQSGPCLGGLDGISASIVSTSLSTDGYWMGWKTRSG